MVSLSGFRKCLVCWSVRSESETLIEAAACVHATVFRWLMLVLKGVVWSDRFQIGSQCNDVTAHSRHKRHPILHSRSDECEWSCSILTLLRSSAPDVNCVCGEHRCETLVFCLQSYRKAVSTARRDKKGARAAGLTEEQKQEIRQVCCVQNLLKFSSVWLNVL